MFNRINIHNPTYGKDKMTRTHIDSIWQPYKQSYPQMTSPKQGSMAFTARQLVDQIDISVDLGKICKRKPSMTQFEFNRNSVQNKP